MKHLLTTITSGLILIASITSARAATITFDLSSFTNGASAAFSSGGVNLLIDNGLNYNGSPIDLWNVLGGLAASDSNVLTQVDFTFSHDVKLVSYSVSNAENDGDGAFFNLSQGALSSDNNSVDTVGGPFVFSNMTDVFLGSLAIQLLVGDAVGVGLIGGQEGEAFALNAITVETVVSVVPLPAAFPLFASIIAGMGFVGWRKKRDPGRRILSS